MLFPQLNEVYVIISMVTSHVEIFGLGGDQMFSLTEGLHMEI